MFCYVIRPLRHLRRSQPDFPLLTADDEDITSDILLNKLYVSCAREFWHLSTSKDDIIISNDTRMSLIGPLAISVAEIYENDSLCSSEFHTWHSKLQVQAESVRSPNFERAEHPTTLMMYPASFRRSDVVWLTMNWYWPFFDIVSRKHHSG